MSEDRIKTIGRYEIEREIGRGGMAVVYKAHDPHLDRAVAIKLIRKGAFTGDQLETLPERFRREARALAKLDHANIVNVLDYGEHEGATYLVMEYLEGATLKEVRKPLRVETAVRLIRPIAEALDYVHDHGILHRDVKPSNIMITRNEKIMLTDFGIAKWLEDENDQYTLTAAGVGIGTPEYMAPEQGLGKKIDARADAYSLSVVFYELITGRKPFQGETALETLTKQASEPFPDPRTYVPELNESVKKFLDRALAKKPEDRYPTMKDYLRDLDGLRLQSLAQASSGQTGIQTVRSSESATDSSIRFGKTDMRKVREAAAAVGDRPPERPKHIGVNRKRQFIWLIPLLAGAAVLAGFFVLRGWNMNKEGKAPAAPVVPGITETILTIAMNTDEPTAASGQVQSTENAEKIRALSGRQLSATESMPAVESMAPLAETAGSTLAIAADQQTSEISVRQTSAAEQKLTPLYETLSALGQRLTETKIFSRGAVDPTATLAPTEDPRLLAAQTAQAATATAARLQFEETALAIHQKETELAIVAAELTLTADAMRLEKAAAETEKAVFAMQTPAAETVTETESPQQSAVAAAFAPTAYAPYADISVGDMIEFGRYEQDNNLSNGAEAIEWEVLEIRNGIAMLISVYGLDTKPFHHRYAHVTWEESSLRAWLNNGFVESAFTSSERRLISEKTLVNDDNSTYKTSGGNATNDNVYLLSIKEAKKYIKNASVEVTAYAKTNGASADGDDYGQWWLRSPGFDGARFAIGAADGSFDDYGVVLNQADIVIRPVINLNIGYKRLTAKTDDLSSIQVGDDVVIGRYEQDNNLLNGAEPILWQVLDVSNDSAILISHSVLDSKRYNNEWAFVSWETCSLRKWLNEEFYESAFDADDQLLIERSLLTTENNPTYGTYGGAETEDKVYVLSAKETEAYSDANYFSTDAEATKYALAQGFVASWWQRSPGRSGRYVTTPHYWEREVSRDGFGVRPVIKIRTDLRIGGVPDEMRANSGPSEISAEATLSVPLSELPSADAEPTVRRPSLSADNPYADVKVGDVIEFGRYEQDNDLVNGPEAIEWQVLDVSDGSALLISRYGLASRSYHNRNKIVTWEECELREWLNLDFFRDAFSHSEKKYIETTHLSNASGQRYGIKPGNDTDDRVFLLSQVEAESYFANDSSKQLKVTDYASENGVWVAGNGNSWWWLRGITGKIISSDVVTSEGSITWRDVTYEGNAVRPSIRINLEDIISELSVLYEEARPLVERIANLNVGDTLQFGVYEQDNNYLTDSEVIEWQVLDVSNGTALLISRYGLDVKPYHEKKEAVTWETSTLRAWLNGYFYQESFNEEEKRFIILSNLNNMSSPKYETKGGNKTDDYVFLLSLDEADQFFSSNEEEGKVEATNYAASYYQGNDWFLSNYAQTWWLRSPGLYYTDALEAHKLGSLYDYRQDVLHRYYAVRPALRIKLD